MFSLPGGSELGGSGGCSVRSLALAPCVSGSVDNDLTERRDCRGSSRFGREESAVSPPPGSEW